MFHTYKINFHFFSFHIFFVFDFSRLIKVDPHAPNDVLDHYLSIGLECDKKDVRWDQFVDPDLFLRRLRRRLYRPHRCWVKNARVKLVHSKNKSGGSF